MSAIATYKITLGDTLEPLKAVIRRGNGDALDISTDTMKFRMQKPDGTDEIAETALGVTIHPTQAVTFASTGLATCVGHGFEDDDEVLVSTGGSLSGTGLTANTPYWVVNRTPNKFGLAETPGGPTVIAGAGTGNHLITKKGSIQFDFASTGVDTAGKYIARFVRISGSEKDHHPEAPAYIEIIVSPEA